MAIFDGQDMVYDGYNFAKDVYVEQVRRPLLQPIENQYEELETHALHRKTRRNSYHIEVDIRLIESKRRDVTELKRHLAGKLYKSRPCRLYLRGDWRFDMAVLDSEINFDRFLRTGFATLRFLVYGASYGDLKSPKDTLQVYNTGTDESRPVITIRPATTQSQVRIENLTTKESVTIARSIPVGATLQIGDYTESLQYMEVVTLNGNSIMGSIWYDADFPTLAVGLNEFSITGVTGADFAFWERWL